MNSKRLRPQFVRFKIRGLMAFFVAAIMIVSLIGLGILLWYELTDPERLEPKRAQLPGVYRFLETYPAAIPSPQLVTSRSRNSLASWL
jgi:hypothetical protein